MTKKVPLAVEDRQLMEATSATKEVEMAQEGHTSPPCRAPDVGGYPTPLSGRLTRATPRLPPSHCPKASFFLYVCVCEESLSVQLCPGGSISRGSPMRGLWMSKGRTPLSSATIHASSIVLDRFPLLHFATNKLTEKKINSNDLYLTVEGAQTTPISCFVAYIRFRQWTIYFSSF